MLKKIVELLGDPLFSRTIDNLIGCFAVFSSIRDERGEIVDFRYDYISEEGRRNNGLPDERYLNSTLLGTFPAHGGSEIFEKYKAVVETGTPLVLEAYGYADRFGKNPASRVFDIRATKLGDGFAVAWDDLTEWAEQQDKVRAAEQVLRESETRLRAVFESAPFGFGIFDLEGTLVHVNEANIAILGYPRNELVGKKISDLTYPDDREADEQARSALCRGEIDSYQLEKRIVKKDQAIAWIETFAKKIRSSEGGQYFAIVKDITERKRLAQALAKSEEDLKNQEQMVIRAAKMTALGQMAGGISHEINNPLTVIYGNACRLLQLAQGNSRFDIETVKLCAERIEKTCRRIEKIIEGLRAFSRENPENTFEEASVHEIIEDTLSFCEAKFSGHRIDLEVRESSPDLTIACRPVQISEILLNLLNNAYDALRDIEGERKITIEVKELKQVVEISVTDSGPGIPKEFESTLFQPFKTSKPIGQGTGLGLSISKGLAEGHHGSLRYLSRKGKTSFVLSLPRTNPSHGRAELK